MSVDVYKRQVVTVTAENLVEALIDSGYYAARHGIGHIVFLSLIGVERNPIVPVSYTHLDVYKRQVYILSP